ncbi:MAG TPA: hypothetical protein VF169_15055 [Albitalea sp.]|uniref:pPIWI_RE_Z domain-containing protein n=1 Tax=Piscinibacter sp. TaxID=1903157 RepID=UPI002ED40CF3
MRQAKPFVVDYAAQVLMAESGANPDARTRDTALTDLCLHFLANHAASETIDAIPPLLQGHMLAQLVPDSHAPLATLRHLASSFCSRLAWRNALSHHRDSGGRTLYTVTERRAQRQRSPRDAGYALLSDALSRPAPYERRAVHFASAGDWVAPIRWNRATVGYKVPEVESPSRLGLNLQRRTVHPPIAIRWSDLMACAAEVDRREQSVDFPAWLPPLHLERRLQRVSIEAMGSGLWHNETLTLSGTQHLVGMLSSGKSTLLLSLLFLLSRPGYARRILVIANDTAAASMLVARLRAHGMDDATVVSSKNNREEHLSAAHWSVGGVESEQKLLAAAALTQSLGISCPLEGFQRAERDVVSQAEPGQLPRGSQKLEDKPCHGLLPARFAQRASAAASHELHTCPLIAKCPVHSQQRALPQARVIVMTPQALLNMSADKFVLGEHMSFPELFQYQADVVLIDEADSVQQVFDDELLQDETLLGSDSGAFLPDHQRLMANSLQDRLGGQYAKAATVRWQSAFARLQGTVALAYHLLLRFERDLAWVAHGQPFTAASILCDLWSSGGTAGGEARNAYFEQLAILASTLYSDVAEDDGQEAVVPEGITDAGLREAYAFLKPLQRTLLERGTDTDDDAPIARIIAAVEDGPLKMFRSMHLSERSRLRGKSIPNDSAARGRALSLALLTNVVLSTFGYLVRNQPAVEDDFRLATDNVFSRARRLQMHYGALIPRPLYGTVFGLLFEQGSEDQQGGVLKLVNHLGVGRYLLTNFHRLLADEGQAGPHVLLLSGTSWAGGSDPAASPRYDVQTPVAGVLHQPRPELEALEHSVYEFPSLGDVPIPVSGQAPDVRRENLRHIAKLLARPQAAGSRLEQQWFALERRWGPGSLNGRRKALLVVSNYRDAGVVANALVAAGASRHPVYCLVSDSVARKAGFAHAQAREAEAYGNELILLPRSRVETFGTAPEGAVLVAPIGPVSRGHNIVGEDGRAAISSIYFLHRPHPRPDDIQSIVGCVNRFTMEWLTAAANGEGIAAAAKAFERKARFALDDGFALRRAYSIMPKRSRTQYTWDLITQLWQSIGRGIRGGAPVYVGFVDERFAPQVFAGAPQSESADTSCLLACLQTLEQALSSPVHGELARRLYAPFLAGLKQLFKSTKEGSP